MRVFFDTDLEGAVGVYNMEMCLRGDPLFSYAYAELAKDINAAVEGAFLGGADECVVCDGHGAQGLKFDLIDPRAIRGNYGMMKEGFDVMFCIANHAQAGTQNAFLDHTQNSREWFCYKINGRPSGEIAQSAMQAAHYGAPVVLVTGDEAAVTEAHNFLGEVETVAVKRGIGRQQCEMYDPEESRAKIREAARIAVSNFINGTKEYRLYTPALPAICELTFMRTDACDRAMSYKSNRERIDGRTVRWVAQSYLEI